MEIKDKDKKRFKKMVGLLDSKGLMIYVHKVGTKSYNLIVNGEIVKVYKQRSSCNEYISKLFKERA